MVMKFVPLQSHSGTAESISVLIDVVNVLECRIQVSENAAERTRLNALIGGLRVSGTDLK